MEIIINKFVEWAIQNKRWPLLLLLFIPLVVVFYESQLEFSFYETIDRFDFWVIVAFNLIITGVLFYLILRKNIIRLYVSIPLIIFGTIAILYGYFQQKLPSLPKDKMVVAIAKFSSISPAAVDEALNFQHRIEQQLHEKIREGVPLNTKLLPIQVTGVDDYSKRDSALNIINSELGQAHAIIWGEIRKEEGETFCKLRITISEKTPNINFTGDFLRGFLFHGNQIDIEFKENFADNIANTILYICGLSYYNSGNWDKALEIFNNVKSEVGYLYKGFTLIKKSESSLNPVNILKEAMICFEKVINSTSAQFDARSNRIYTDAYINTGTVYLYLSEFVNNVEKIELLQKSKEIFSNYLETFNDQVPFEKLVVIKGNLGLVFYHLGKLKSGKEGLKLLNDSVEIFRSILKIINKSEQPHKWAIIQSNLGVILYNMGIEIQGDNAINIWKNAYKVLLEVINQTDKSSYPFEWHYAYGNLGLVSSVLGKVPGCTSSDKFLNDAKFIYMTLLNYFTKSEFPYQWILTQKNLALTHREIGIRATGKIGINILKEAIDSCQHALEICDTGNFSNIELDLQENIGKFYYDMSLRTESPEEKVEFLVQAKKSLDNALDNFKEEKQLERYERILNNKTNISNQIDSLMILQ